jgi:hypothetical protein
MGSRARAREEASLPGGRSASPFHGSQCRGLVSALDLNSAIGEGFRFGSLWLALESRATALVLIACSLSSLALAFRGKARARSVVPVFCQNGHMAAPVVTPGRILSAFGPCGLTARHTVRSPYLCGGASLS